MAALDELNLKLKEIRDDVAFVILAYQLRPRLAEAMSWENQTDVHGLAKKFMSSKSSRPEDVFGPLLVRLLAAFERYLRGLVGQSVEHFASKAVSFDNLSEHLATRNLVLTGRVLAGVENPREHLTFDTNALISNLSSCKKGSTEFRLNPPAFAAGIVGVSPAVLDRALKDADLDDCWDGVGANSALATHLGTRGSRATGVRAKEKLKELWRWRNHLAHGGDEEPSLSEAQLSEAIDFINRLAVALDSTVKKQL